MSQPPLLALGLISAPLYEARRDAARTTWLSGFKSRHEPRHGITVRFAIATRDSGADEEVRAKLEDEQARSGACL